MFSKEWKLVALSFVAVATLTACPHSKKSPEATSAFKGYWVNGDAYDRLSGLAVTNDPRICININNSPRHLGITRGFDGELNLDAWVIYGNGGVYRYSPAAQAASWEFKQRYYVGQINGTSFNPKNKVGMGVFSAADRSAYSMGGPLGRGALGTSVRLENNQMMAYSPGYGPYSTVFYVRVTPDQLNQMSAVLAVCNETFDSADGWSRRPQVLPGQVPAPGQLQLGPQVAPQQFGPPAQFEMPPK